MLISAPERCFVCWMEFAPGALISIGGERLCPSCAADDLEDPLGPPERELPNGRPERMWLGVTTSGGDGYLILACPPDQDEEGR